MRSHLAAAFALGFLTILATPTTVATHGDTGYVVTSNGTIIRGQYAYGPGFADQFWNFIVAAPNGPVDFCNDVHGGWEHGGFAGVCQSGAAFTISSTDHYHPYPNPGVIDVHPVTVGYAGVSSDGQAIICDNGLRRLQVDYCVYLP